MNRNIAFVNASKYIFSRVRIEIKTEKFFYNGRPVINDKVRKERKSG